MIPISGRLTLSESADIRFTRIVDGRVGTRVCCFDGSYSRVYSCFAVLLSRLGGAGQQRQGADQKALCVHV